MAEARQSSVRLAVGAGTDVGAVVAVGSGAIVGAGSVGATVGAGATGAAHAERNKAAENRYRIRERVIGLCLRWLKCNKKTFRLGRQKVSKQTLPAGQCVYKTPYAKGVCIRAGWATWLGQICSSSQLRDSAGFAPASPPKCQSFPE